VSLSSCEPNLESDGAEDKLEGATACPFAFDFRARPNGIRRARRGLWAMTAAAAAAAAAAAVSLGVLEVVVVTAAAAAWVVVAPAVMAVVAAVAVSCTSVIVCTDSNGAVEGIPMPTAGEYKGAKELGITASLTQPDVGTTGTDVLPNNENGAGATAEELKVDVEKSENGVDVGAAENEKTEVLTSRSPASFPSSEESSADWLEDSGLLLLSEVVVQLLSVLFDMCVSAAASGTSDENVSNQALICLSVDPVINKKWRVACTVASLISRRTQHMTAPACAR
jgi:hypothetical protein